MGGNLFLCGILEGRALGGKGERERGRNLPPYLR